MGAVVSFSELDFDEQVALAVDRGPATLSKLLNPDRTIARHVEHLSDLVFDAVHTGLKTGIGPVTVVMLPPGHAKSDTISVHAIAWYLSRFPQNNVALASYEHNKAAKWGRQVREIVRQSTGTLPVELSKDEQAAYQWGTTLGGGLLCTGIGGPLTGYRAHALFIDDPVKNAEEAASEVLREKAWDWYTSVVLTRLWPEAPVFLVMTRWHEDDLAGRIIAHNKQAALDGKKKRPLIVCRIPCIAEDADDPLGRAPGDPLWPELGYTKDWAERTETEVGSYVWATLYQQRPSPKGGAVFQSKNFRYFYVSAAGYYVLVHDDGEEQYAPGECWVAQTVDTAMRDRTVNDWTVVLTYAVTPKRQVLILDVARERLDVPDQLPLIRRKHAQYRPRWVGIEDKGSGVGIVQEARRQGFILRPLKADTNKVARASAASALYEQHAVFHRRDAHWLDAFERELLSFPTGTHDDQVDTIAHAVNHLAAAGVMTARGGKRRHNEMRMMTVGDAIVGMT